MQRDSRFWLAAVAVTAAWVGLTHALTGFSERLPELARIYNRSYALSTLLLPAAATVAASAWRGRSVRRSLGAYAGAMTFASVVVAQHYWQELRYYSRSP
jgi:hypothetical protein